MYKLKGKVLKRQPPMQSECDVVKQAAVQSGQYGSSLTRKFTNEPFEVTSINVHSSSPVAL